MKKYSIILTISIILITGCSKSGQKKTSFSNFPLTNDEEYFYLVIEPLTIKEKLNGKEISYPDWLILVIHSNEDDNHFILKLKIKVIK